LTQRIVTNYAPPEPVATWSGLDERFDEWVTAYAAFAARTFFRRELPSVEADPATPFARWLKDNASVFFNHPERGYRYVAKLIQEALKQKRAVLVVLMDAMAPQLAGLAAGYLADAIDTQPTRLNYVFAPLPTISEVCKEAILTGQFPSECRGNLREGLLRSYELEPDQLELAANWRDAERLQFGPKTRLVVYRDNRIDDQLKTAGTYKVLVEECPAVLSRVARLVRRWVDDLKHLHDSPPLFVLTADHGFTFGPSPGSHTRSQRKIEGGHRCVKLSDSITDAELRDESLTVIDREVFHLHNNYLAARGRYFGDGTASGWTLSHGGLLPEEVIVPVVEWFGGEVSVLWPELSFPQGASRDRDKWILSVALRNTHAVALFGLVVRIGVAGEGYRASRTFSRIGPGETTSFTVDIPSTNAEEGNVIPIDVTLTLIPSERHASQERVRQYAVPKAKQFVIRTTEQAAFEEMF
jgi:hypothetical protein